MMTSPNTPSKMTNEITPMDDPRPSEVLFALPPQPRHNITIGELIDFVAQEATKKVIKNLEK